MDKFFEADTIKCPYPHYAQMRAEDSVHKLDDDDVFLVTRHADCRDVLAQPSVFSSKAGPGLRQKELMTAPVATEGQGHRIVRTLLTNDPPSHTRFRALVAKAFAPRRVKAIEPQMHALVDDLIDNFAADGNIEFIEAFARPLPLTVIADFLGVSHDDLDLFRRWSDDAAEVLGGQLTPERSAECQASLNELLDYLQVHVEDRRAHPRDDFLTTLVEASIDGERGLSTEEILAIGYVTLVAGNETTVNLLGSLMSLLVQHPDQFEKLRADRSLIPGAIEEALRMEAPVQGSVRRALEDTEVGGCPVPKGSRLLVLAGAANRDAETFADAERFDIERADAKEHLTFGKGIHFCLGANLSRVEARIALEHLIDRIDEITAVPGYEPHYAENAVIRSLVSLPIRVSAPRPR
ncbi:cytochrome P450 [Gordonia polyisoprenivorans]|uniref:cytochrome P450 n=1 Tax=Gordonia polyisoprenivorans TaxID=84595 RepID=UPI001AD660A3|nr:cytochrome P450 [Gordonia polyisoprenivorans]QTI68996.1 cytochrome P450 [Gordonia polyisoprenivorans]